MTASGHTAAKLTDETTKYYALSILALVVWPASLYLIWRISPERLQREGRYGSHLQYIDRTAKIYVLASSVLWLVSLAIFIKMVNEEQVDTDALRTGLYAFYLLAAWVGLRSARGFYLLKSGYPISRPTTLLV